MARKQFNFVLTPTTVTAQKLAYEDADAPATVAAEKTFEVSGLPEVFGEGENAVSLLAYGLSQFLQDRTSSVPGEEKLEKMEEIFAALAEGQWKATRVSSGGTRKASIDPFFAEGFAKFLQSKGKDVDTNTATVLLQDMDADQRKALRAHADVKAFVEQAKESAASAASEIDLESLLS